MTRYFDRLGIIDCNVFIGNWAFRRLRRNTAVDIVAMMDAFGIERACAASADAILYKDCQAGNDKLYEETRAHADRFWLYATLNPAYPGWERDMSRCVRLGFRALRLYPCYHGYRLDSREARAIIEAAADLAWPVSIPARVEDVRQKHAMDTTQNVAVTDVIGAAETCPKAAFVLSEFYPSIPRNDDLWKRLRGVRCYFELSRMTACLDANLQAAFDELGHERILFGTGFPFKTPSPAFLKLQALQGSDEAKSRIASGNARSLFNA